MIHLDTSVLVAATIQQHPCHRASQRFVEKGLSGSERHSLATHGLAELYSSLSAIPGSPRLTPADVLEILTKSVMPNLTIIPLETADYQRALERAASRNLPSGAIYDALHVQAALKAKAEALVTWNVDDFRRLAGPELTVMIPE